MSTYHFFETQLFIILNGARNTFFLVMVIIVDLCQCCKFTVAKLVHDEK